MLGFSKGAVTGPLSRAFALEPTGHSGIYDFLLLGHTKPEVMFVKSMRPRKKLPVANRNIDQPFAEDVYPAIDTDLARDNIENDMPAAEVNELYPRRPSGT